jgi:hypothetical protein
MTQDHLLTVPLGGGRDLRPQAPASTCADGQCCAYAGHAGCAGELLVTALLAVFDPATGELLLASAGQLPPAVVRPRTAASTAASAQADPGPWAEFAQVEPGPPLGIAGSRPVLRLVALVAVPN